MTISELTQKITDLEAQAAANVADLAAAEALALEAQAKLSTAQAEVADLGVKLTAETAKVTAAEAKAADAAAKLTASETELAKARETNARFGAPAARNDSAAQSGNEKPTMQLTEFNALPLSERNKFMRDGGKLAA